MGVDVRQLTINSTIQRDSDGARESGNELNEDKKNVKESSGKESGSCFDVDSVKEDILAECRKMIRLAFDEQRGR